MNTAVSLPRDSNQALGIGQFAVDFIAGHLGSGPGEAALAKTRLLHTDAVLCGASALALRTNAPAILRKEALDYADPHGATPLGVSTRVKAEKAIVANASC